MIMLPKLLPSHTLTSQFISECEKNFEARLDEVCSNLLRDNVKIIALSGPTCSGKTTTANKITRALTDHGLEVHLVSIDDFFLDRSDEDMKRIAEGKPIDYDSVDALDLEYLKKCAVSIIKGDPTELPVYSFTQKKRTHYNTVDPNDHSVFIFEGIQAIYPEVTALLGDNYRSVYISVEDDLSIDGNVFAARELRLMRRIVRDYNFRGAAPEFTFYLWQGVAANEDKSIIPFANSVDIKINSFIGYEIYLMKSVLPELLALVLTDSPYRENAAALLKKLEGIECISPELVPSSSVLREFIG